MHTCRPSSASKHKKTTSAQRTRNLTYVRYKLLQQSSDRFASYERHNNCENNRPHRLTTRNRRDDKLPVAYCTLTNIICRMVFVRGKKKGNERQNIYTKAKSVDNASALCFTAWYSRRTQDID